MTSPTIVDDNHQHRIANKHGVILSRQTVYIWNFVVVAEIHVHTHMYVYYIYVYYFKCVYIYIYICTHIKPYKAVCLCAYMCVGVILTKCDDHIIITKNCVARGFSSLVMNFKFPRTNPQVWWQTNPRENINFLWLNSTTSWLVVSTQSEISAQFMASLFHAGWRKHVVPR